jgi:hypothetical protein
VIRVNQDAVDHCYRRLLFRQVFGPLYDLDEEFEKVLAEYKKQRRMEIDIQIAALLKERDAL